MTSRRSFFTRIAKAIVIASAAPIILRESLRLEMAQDVNAWQDSIGEVLAEYVRLMRKHLAKTHPHIQFTTPNPNARTFEEYCNT